MMWILSWIQHTVVLVLLLGIARVGWYQGVSGLIQVLWTACVYLTGAEGTAKCDVTRGYRRHVTATGTIRMRDKRAKIPKKGEQSQQ